MDTKLQGIAEGWSSTPRLANSSAASFSERNKCSGNHSSLIVLRKEKSLPATSAREILIKGKAEERTERELERRRRDMADLLVVLRPAESSQNGADFSENWNRLGLPKRKGCPQCHQVSSWQGRMSRLYQKEKETKPSARLLDREVRESLAEREPHLGKRVEVIVGPWGGKSGIHRQRRQAPSGRERACKGKA